MRHLLLALLMAAPAQAGTRQQATVLMPADPQMKAVHEDWGFSEAVVSGDTVYLSGIIVGAPREGSDLRASFTRGFEQIGDILKRAGASWDDVVEISSFHTDVATQMPAMKEVKHRFVKAPFPAWTAVQVSRLIPDRGITEIKVVAKLARKG